MADFQRTDCNLHVIDLTNDNTSGSTHITPCIDLTVDDDKGTNHSPEIIDLTDEDNQCFISSIPTIDLTSDNNQFENHRIPVIDLADDDISDVTHQTRRIGSTYNYASISNPNTRNFNDEEMNRCTHSIGLNRDDIQKISPNTPVDLAIVYDRLQNCRMQDVEITSDGVWDITRELECFGLAESKQQHKNDCIPRNDSANHNDQSFRRPIPVSDLTNDKDCYDYIRPVIDLKKNDDGVRKPDDDVEMYDLTNDNSPSSFQETVLENLRRQTAMLSSNLTEKGSLKFNETLNTNESHIRSFSGMQNFERRKNYLENYPAKHNFEDRIETVFTSHSGRSNSEEKYSIPEKISQNNSPDFLKPAHFPIPLRHSFGRSTPNTSPNTPIEYPEVSESQSPTLTASSIIRRKKSKTATSIPKHIPKKSKDLSNSEENTLSFETFTGFILKFWIFLLFSFVVLYYWIF